MGGRAGMLRDGEVKSGSPLAGLMTPHCSLTCVEKKLTFLLYISRHHKKSARKVAQRGPTDKLNCTAMDRENSI